jgi:hypothetical protein
MNYTETDLLSLMGQPNIQDLIPRRSLWEAKRDKEWMGKPDGWLKKGTQIVVTNASWHWVEYMLVPGPGIGGNALASFLDNYVMVSNNVKLTVEPYTYGE